MELNKNVELLAGFYADEGYHIWGGDSVFILLRNAKYMTARFTLTLGKGGELEIINCCRNECISYAMSKKDSKITVDIDLIDDSVLLNFKTSDYLQPIIDCPGSEDYRRLGICFHEIQIVSSDFKKLIESLKVDKEQSLFNLRNFNKKYVHDADFRFLELFADIEISGCFLDIGANIGQSACSAASVHPSIKIISYEPNKLLEKNLELIKKILGGRMDYYLCGIGAEDEKRKFYIPKYKDHYFTQEGSFLKEEACSAESKNRIEASLNESNIQIEIEEMEFETVTLDESSVQSYFIKIDTQGYERDSIIGLKRVIDDYQPIILIEKGFDEKELCRLLPDYGIYHYNVKDKRFVTSDTGTANVFLIHKNGTKSRDINEVLFKHLQV